MAIFYCTKCGTPVNGSSKFCANCGEPVVQPSDLSVTPPSVPNEVSPVGYTGSTHLNGKFDRPCPETHLTKAILLTIFCCWPLGIPAIINASGVSNSYIAGNYDLAVEKSEKAKKWCNYCIIGGIAFWVIYILIMIILVVIEASMY